MQIKKKNRIPWQWEISEAPSFSVDWEYWHVLHSVAPYVLEKDPIGQREHTGVPSTDQ